MLEPVRVKNQLLEKKLQWLKNKQFEDPTEAKIALADFKMYANAFGYRGRFDDLTIQDSKVISRA